MAAENQEISNPIQKERYRSFQIVQHYRTGRTLARLILIFLAIFSLFLFLPWTQNIRSNGFLTTLRPEQRPQTIQSVIAGRIERWYVREGELVKKGDTILHLTEIRDAYFDPMLLERTRLQIAAKSSSRSAFGDKVRALDTQVAAILQTLELKTEQARNDVRRAELKVLSDSMDFQAARVQNAIAEVQLRRMEQLYTDGLNPLTDLESRQLRFQESQARAIGAENRFLASQNELLNARVEQISIEQQYREKLAKAQSERAASISQIFDADGDVAKMEGQYSSYEVRTGYYYVLAPQDGYITRTIRAGIGETVSEGEELATIMPIHIELAVEMYVRPIDLPLIHAGNKVRLQFDGWPAIIFSGWPTISYGTFGGEITAIDNYISDNGMYRVLVTPDPGDHEWPGGLRVGSGAVGMTLLNDVAIWYELWRQLNGFPPDFYTRAGVSQEGSQIHGGSRPGQPPSSGDAGRKDKKNDK
jgi:membrane fusion protein, adhesin transport system